MFIVRYPMPTQFIGTRGSKTRVQHRSEQQLRLYFMTYLDRGLNPDQIRGSSKQLV